MNSKMSSVPIHSETIASTWKKAQACMTVHYSNRAQTVTAYKALKAWRTPPVHPARASPRWCDAHGPGRCSHLPGRLLWHSQPSAMPMMRSMASHCHCDAISEKDNCNTAVPTSTAWTSSASPSRIIIIAKSPVPQPTSIAVLFLVRAGSEVELGVGGSLTRINRTKVSGWLIGMPHCTLKSLAHR